MQLSRILNLLLSLIVLFSLGSVAMGCFTPQLFTITPNNGVNNQTIDLILIGKHFSKKSSVKLALAGQEDIIPTAVKFVSKTHLICAFDLNGKTPGNWDVIVLNKARKLTTLKGGFKIEATPVETPVPAEQDATVEETPVEEEVIEEEVEETQVEADAEEELVGEDVMDESEVEADAEEELVEEDVVDESEVEADVEEELVGEDVMDESEVEADAEEELVGEDVVDESEVEADAEEELVGEDVVDESEEEVLAEDEAEVEALVEEEKTSTAELNDSLESIFFDYNKSEIRPDQVSALEADLEILSENGELFISLSGHADERGSNEYNIGLSSRRAEAVKQYLIDQGIDPERILVFAYGEEYPLKSGHDEESWQFNRRVDIMVWEYEPSEEECIRTEE